MAAPVKNTCPDIDRVIKKVSSAYKTAHTARCRSEKGTDEYDYFDSIEDDLMYVEGELEDLRSDNSSLREWGNDLEDQLQVAAEKIDELERKIEKLETK